VSLRLLPGSRGHQNPGNGERTVSGTLFGRQGLRMVVSNPNRATAFDTQGSEPYGLLRLLNRKGYLTPFPFRNHSTRAGLLPSSDQAHDGEGLGRVRFAKELANHRGRRVVDGVQGRVGLKDSVTELLRVCPEVFSNGLGQRHSLLLSS